MNRRQCVRLSAGILGILLMIGVAYAMIQTLTNDQLIAGSDLIAVASLRKSTETGKDEKGFSQVENILSLQEVLKGEAKAGDDIIVDTLGGFEDEVIFRPRQRVLVFLTPGATAGRRQVNNFVQGVWPVNADGSLGGMGEGQTLDTVKQAIERLKTQPPASATAPQGDAL
ncbi:MAG TPA: hypothetical protein PLP29_01430 [Candidatus Ozemobacteraceae bacterium]|nr:hypothetical protein [Candidatus Ozemobacteraceae bacterium]